MASEVSIVILSCNHWDYTLRLLASLTLTTGPAFETIVIDNGSEASVVDALSDLAGSLIGHQLRLRCAFNPVNRGIASGRNQGASLACGDLLLFLDNDVMVFEPRWLDQMREVLGQVPSAGAVGAVLLDEGPALATQFAGGSVDRTGRVDFWKDPRSAEELPDGAGATCYALGACLLTPRGLFDRLGGFDPIFNPMDYEDIDYCLRALHQHRRRSVIAIGARLLHRSHVTTGGRDFSRLRNYLVNGRRFLRRWQQILEPSESGSI